MIAEYLIDLFKKCEYISFFEIYNDYMSENNNCISIKNIQGERVLKNYSDGSKILSNNFEILIRLGAKNKKNSENTALIENIVGWIRRLENKSNIFEPFEKGIPLSVEIEEGPIIKEDNLHSIQYKLKCTFKYLENCF